MIDRVCVVDERRQRLSGKTPVIHLICNVISRTPRETKYPGATPQRSTSMEQIGRKAGNSMVLSSLRRVLVCGVLMSFYVTFVRHRIHL